MRPNKGSGNDSFTWTPFAPKLYSDSPVKERFNSDLWKSDGWRDRRIEDIKTLVGWLIMTFLLSIGAPFWQDTLESLFGVKNLIRSKAAAKPEGETG